MKELLRTTAFACILSTPAFGGTVEFAQASNAVSTRHTEAKRGLLWEEVKGQHTHVTGRVTDVEAAGWILNAAVHIDVEGYNNLSVTCYVEEKYNDEVIERLSKGDRFLCSGYLSNYMILLDTNISLTDSTPSYYR
ncbi:MAG: hypothetical protein FH759_07575 [Sediminimonas qiaohouensis]|uniref:DNA-binding protein n=1 Tax=Sediminimonas qiaohouensis TaxID=552061 RepID=A0A7C9L7T1_9RHOB|nr:hypothetical protein [Sediminimonas qiaohouensis]MTJ04535.1 hypothetical protein [Sediminimonas qiaohouensis]